MQNTSLNSNFVAITGGIGSGKSTICKILEILGYSVFYTDKSAQHLIRYNTEVAAKIKKRFGETIYNGDGQLDKRHLAEIIFTDPQALHAINTIVHPAVWNDFIRWSKKQDSPKIFLESAILFECRWNIYFKNIICVTAEEKTRISRAAKRDSKTFEEIRKRIDNQIPEEVKIKNSRFIIHTDDEYSELEQLFSILEELLKE